MVQYLVSAAFNGIEVLGRIVTVSFCVYLVLWLIELFCNAWVCICMGFAMCCCFDNCVGVLVICVLVFIVLCIVKIGRAHV